jgi:TolB protein
LRSFRNRTPLPAVALALLLFALASGADGAIAQDQDVQLEIRSRGGAPIKLALPMLTAAPGADEHARTLYDVLWQDLDWSMAFDMVDPAGYPASGGGEIPWEAWRATGARALITGVVSIQGDRLYAEFRLFDVVTGTQVTGKRYTQPLGAGDPGEAAYRVRRVAHLFNDETVLYYTGIRGVADSQIAFVSDREAPAGTPQKEIFISDYDGMRQRRLTYDASIALSPSFSPQADRIAFQTYRLRDSIPNTEIFMILKSGGQPRPIVTCKGTNNGPNFSPDGALIAYSSTCGADNSEIHLVRPDGTSDQRVTRNPGADVSPAWSPNSRQIVFVSDRSGSQQLYVMDATGLNTRRLAAQGGQKDDPAWQPGRGELIAYTASTGGNNFDIFVYDLTTDRAYQLTRGRGRKEAPTWSPDGRQLAFEWARGSSIQIWVMGLDGSRQRQLTGIGNNVTPSWGNRP